MVSRWAIRGWSSQGFRAVIEREPSRIISRCKLAHACDGGPAALADLLGKGELKPHLSANYQFGEVAQAHTQLGSGRTFGKVVIVLEGRPLDQEGKEVVRWLTPS